MALSDKDILITPNIGQTDDPKIEFKGADSTTGPQTISLNVYSTSNGTLSFEGSAGQLFSITNDLSGTIFSVNDVSGIPSIEVNADGTVKLAEFDGNVGIGTSLPSEKLHVVGNIVATGNITANFSDDKLKTKLGEIENALEKLCSLSGFYYEANKTAQELGYKPIREVGISAQKVQKVLPEVVKPAPINSQYLTVQYERLVPLLIEAIKELNNKINKLEG